MAVEETQAEEGCAQQRQRAGLGDIGPGEEERVDQPGCVNASSVDIAQPGKYSVERIADRSQEEIIAEFAIGGRAARSLLERQRREAVLVEVRGNRGAKIIGRCDV